MGFLDKLRNSRSAVSDAMGEIDLLREQISDTKAELRRISAAPQPVEEALAAFDAWAEKQATAAVDRLRPGRLLEPAAAPSGLSLPHVMTRVGDELIGNHGDVSDMLLGLILAASMPTLREVVHGQLEDLLGEREAMTTQQRASALAEAEAQLLHLELAEEGLVRGLEVTGVEVARRADADPRAVLAADASLPG